MNDDIFRPEGADWVEPARPPVEPVVDVSATDGFAVDGTDAFAIDERPIPMPVEAPAPEPDDVPALSRGRLVATVGAALTGLLVVILVGSSTGPRPVVSEAGVLRTDDGVTTTTGPDGSTPEGAWTSLLGLWGSSAFAPVYEFDDSDEFATQYYETDPYGTTYPTEFETDFDSQFDTQFDTGFDDSSTFTYNTLPPRRLPVFTTPSRSRFVPPRVIPTTTTTTAPTTTTIESTTTTQATTTTTTNSTTTTGKPIPTWVAASSGLPVQCPEGTRLAARPNGVVAAVPGHGLLSTTDRGQKWTALGTGDEGTFPAFVQDPSTADRFWVAGPDGVFRTDNGGASFTELGTPNLADVRALGVHVSTSGAVTLLAVQDPSSRLSLSTNGGATWTQVIVPTEAGNVGQVLVLDNEEALIGTDAGVYRMAAGGAIVATPEHSGAVVGEPVRSGGGRISWRLADGGVIRRSLTGTTWTVTSKPPVAITSLGHLADGTLVATGPETLRVLSPDETSWSTFGPKVPFTPAGVVYSSQAKATFIWKGTCGGDAVMRLDDV